MKEYINQTGRENLNNQLQRPILDKNLDSRTFRDYYYLKEELVEFCRKNGLPVSGAKLELTERIAKYLDTGEIVAAKKRERKHKPEIEAITIDSIIEADFVCSEKHRAFFKEHIGKNFSFNVAFQKWLKSHAGNTYNEAIDAYYMILEEKKKGSTKIDKQFEYNTYIRDFFADNQGKTLDDAIKCWKYKKSLSGHNRYEQSDLIAIGERLKN